MSNVVISNRSIFNQRINNIDKNRVVLPFNVTKEQKDKLIKLLESTTIEFVNEIDRLEISKFIFGNIEVKSVRDIANSTFTLSKSYVATMKQNIISNVDAFLDKEVAIAGRVMSRRMMGKASFAHIMDGQGKIQIYLKIDNIGAENYEEWKKKK